ncbi:RimJ/RimL family protein N-acetyltransferase [Novosphingobium sp. PhB165]|uniref:GNAT family N-acetyltransferase n=1 Tax=Novosphingobium sp. PhB165 TaxID=2485105 RepID=UPI0010522A2F|nr:GNAT family N-acetyltransferase [Novosphingobium sp. PhB165]TCM18013.1 RimJ/RimL family protein N-acetyltransferase [Novosphingobium sp. PhB165]
MDRQPVLEGDRLVLRPLRADDWDALYAVASDREIWAVHPAHDRWQEPVFRQFFADALDGGGAFAIIDKSSGAVIGSSRFGPPEGDEIEIGWTFLARAYWGSGFNAEMKRLMLAYALAHFERVVFMVGANNVISRKAMGHIGGRLTDRTFERVMCGVIVPHVLFEITRESFAAGPLAAG